MPPYITNKGGIYERISSSSCKIVSDKITDAIKLHQLFNKAELQKKKIHDKLYIEPLANDNNLPNNLCAYIDFGFDVTNSRQTKLQQNWTDFDFAPVSDCLKVNCKDFSISRIGKSFLISLGNADTRKNNIPIRPMAGMHNFIEIMTDGSAKGRILLTNDDTNKVDIGTILFAFSYFEDVYKIIFGEQFYKYFIRALKFEKITVLKQFVPYYTAFSENENLKNFLIEHKNKYGNNIVISGNRLPPNDFIIIDKRYLENNNIKFSNDNLISQLFSTYYLNLGYIDRPWEQIKS